MYPVYCYFCDEELKNDDAAVGLTTGVINDDCYGFEMDLDSGWKVFCPECMDKIGRFIADTKLATVGEG